MKCSQPTAFLLGSFLLLALALGPAACKGDPVGATKAEAATLTLRYGTVEAVKHRPQAEITGSLDPLQSVQLGFDVPGRVQRLLVNRGDRVAQGAAIAVLDSSIAAAQAEQANAAVTGAEAQLAAGEAAFERARKLKEAGAISEQDWSSAQASIQQGRAGVQQAKAAAAMARANLDHQTLRAPFAGVIQNGPDNAGIMTGGGTPLFLLDDISALQVKGTAPEDTATWLREGLSAMVFSATPGASVGVPATVVRVLPSLDVATRRLPVEVRITAPPASLKAHGFARVVIDGGDDIDAWKVPRAALVARPDFSVFVEGDTAGDPHRVPVTVLEEQGDSLIVSGALTATAKVVLDPPHTLKE